MNHFYLFCLMFLCSCAISKGDKNTGTVSLNSNENQAISAEVCPAGKLLTYFESDGSSVSNLQPAIAIVSGGENCALTEDINDSWLIPGGNIFLNLKFLTALSIIRYGK